ncbi:Maf family protein [Candidatus Puniceispirillum sp.]|jgi:septum formation protein|uniref:Maf family protein n=1 Tax=Candidatus Puniceispirillum sp. TaxID=2026719 RepID=UPI002FCE0D76
MTQDIFVTLPNDKLVLASSSQTRQTMLANAGIAFQIQSAPVDEASLRDAALAEDMAKDDIAVLLADMKAQAVSMRLAAGDDSYIIGADQLLVCDDVIFAKPHDAKAAEQHLQALSGKTHQLITAAVIYRQGQRIWHHIETADMTVRTLDDNFISAYVKAMGDAALYSPGAYQIEELGVHLFSQIKGCHYAILGLPLLQILGFLRPHGLVPMVASSGLPA